MSEVCADAPTSLPWSHRQGFRQSYWPCDYAQPLPPVTWEASDSRPTTGRYDPFAYRRQDAEEQELKERWHEERGRQERARRERDRS